MMRPKKEYMYHYLTDFEMKTTKEKCRKDISCNTHSTINLYFSIKDAIQPVLGIMTLLCVLPALVYCCSGSPETIMPAPAGFATTVDLKQKPSEIESLDIFVFYDDIFQKLDCYQRFSDMKAWNGRVVSGNGQRILTAIANSPYERDDWLSLKSRSHLKDFRVNLEDESGDRAVMTGEVTVSARQGNSLPSELVLRPLSCEIVLRSISCDFTGKPYKNERITDVRVYLTNVNAETSILSDDTGGPSRIINAGGLCEEDLEAFENKDIILRDIRPGIGINVIYPDIRLRCYRNRSITESPGTPFTRLVIEGVLDGHLYYWPIDINRDKDSDEAGIIGGQRYIFDIRITRKGSSDPDIPVRTEDIVISQTIAEWKEKESYTVTF